MATQAERVGFIWFCNVQGNFGVTLQPVSKLTSNLAKPDRRAKQTEIRNSWTLI